MLSAVLGAVELSESGVGAAAASWPASSPQRKQAALAARPKAAAGSLKPTGRSRK